MKRKLLKISLSIIVFTSLTFLIQKVVSKTLHKREISQKLEVLPAFKLTKTDETAFTNEHLKSGVATIFIYFNSTCDYCQHEARSISQNISDFKNAQLIFISTEPIAVIKKFAKSYQLANVDNVLFLHDKDWIFATEFGANTIPFLLIYDEDKKLLAKHRGQIKAENVLKLLP